MRALISIKMGMIFVPMGGKSQFLGDISEAHGGSPWGAGTITGPDGKRPVSAGELKMAEDQG